MSEVGQKTAANTKNEELDEALAWLEKLGAEQGELEHTKSEIWMPNQFETPAQPLPTWLRQDLGLNTPPAPPVEAPEIVQDNLSWLDSIASGLGAPLDEAPTMQWDETAVHRPAEDHHPEDGNGVQSRQSPLVDAHSAPTVVSRVDLPELPVDGSTSQSPTNENLPDWVHDFDTVIYQTEDAQPEVEEPTRVLGVEQSTAMKDAELTAAIPDDPDEAIAWLEQLSQAGQAKSAEISPPPTDAADPTYLIESEESASELDTIADAAISDDLQSLVAELEQALGHEASATDMDAPPVIDSENTPEDLGEALAWLEDLVGGKETPIDEITIELDESDVPAFLESARQSTPIFAEPAPPPPAEAESLDNVDDTLIVEALAAISNTPIHPFTKTPPPTQSENEPDDLDEALDWLESFASDQSSIFINPEVAPDIAGQAEDTAIINLFGKERQAIREAFDKADYAVVEKLSGELLRRERSGAAEIVISDLTKMLEFAPDQPYIYRILGDAHVELEEHKQAAEMYRQGLVLAMLL